MEVPRPSSPPYFIGRNQFDAFVSRFGPVRALVFVLQFE